MVILVVWAGLERMCAFEHQQIRHVEEPIGHGLAMASLAGCVSKSAYTIPASTLKKVSIPGMESFFWVPANNVIEPVPWHPKQRQYMPDAECDDEKVWQ